MIKQLVTEAFCLNCHGCCRFLTKNSVWGPVLLKEEAKALSADRLLNETITSAGKIPLVKNTGKESNFICLFFNEGLNQCRIHKRRPFECQLYPFLLNRKGSQVFLAADFNCPFLKDSFGTQAFREYVSFLTAYLNDPPCLEILNNNPQLAQAYEGVTNLSELNLVL